MLSKLTEKLKITPKLALFLLGSFVCIMLGMWFFNMPVFGSANRDKTSRSMMRDVRNGITTFRVDVDEQADAIAGEELGYDDAAFAPEGEGDTDEIVLEGTISIPKIGLNAPLLAEATRFNMRYSICYDTGSARPGQEGNCIVFGHRMKKRGKHFNRLDEMAEGDTVYIQMGGKEYTYVIDDIRKSLEPDEMIVLMGLNNVGKRLSLITCTPLGKGTHRLVVMGECMDVRDIA